MEVKLKIVKCPNASLAYSNRVYVHPDKFALFTKDIKASGGEKDPTINIKLVASSGTFIFQAAPLAELKPDELATNGVQRDLGQYPLNFEVAVSVFKTDAASIALSRMNVALDLMAKSATKVEVDADEIGEFFKKTFVNQIFIANQKTVMKYKDVQFSAIVTKIEHIDLQSIATPERVTSASSDKSRGQLSMTTTVIWSKQQGAANTLIITGGAGGTARNDSLFQADFDFEKLGIGGLGAQFQTMFRRAFASRLFPGVYKDVGINHIKGMILFGPPGCGKTLIARKIGKVLNAHEPIIVNGPELISSYQGKSEENVRDLFKPAEEEQRELGDASKLHIIIFDEMDALMKKRGSTSGGTGVDSNIVNQLLTKIDGVDSLNNILIIGMTNRLDLIDEAILRPGRLELHIEIALPDVPGRQQIINIHTQKLKDTKRIKNDVVDMLPTLAELTKNYTGAEIEGLIKNAFSFAIARNVDPSNIKTANAANISVEWHDIERALRECVPAFGSKENEEIKGHVRNGICSYGSAFDDLWTKLGRLMNQTRTSVRTPLMSVLLEGHYSTGKTAIAASLVTESDFPYIRMLSADSMIGYSEHMKIDKILRTFRDSYKSNLSIIFIDDIERIIEYTPVGARFNNAILQTLLILIRKVPPKPPVIPGVVQADPRLLVIATSSIANLLEDIQLTSAFNVSLHVSQLQSQDEYAAVIRKYAEDVPPEDVETLASVIQQPIGIKQLMMVLEMARDENGKISVEGFQECLSTYCP